MCRCSFGVTMLKYVHESGVAGWEIDVVISQSVFSNTTRGQIYRQGPSHSADD